MSNIQNNDSQPNEDRKRIANGAGLVFLGRMGALIEAVSLFVFAWYYGPETFGLFALLWTVLTVSTVVSDVAMTTAMQRFVPKAKEGDAEKYVGYALKLTLLISTAIAAVVCYFAPHLAPFINVGEASAEHLITVIRIYIWVLPLWTMVEVATAAIRARRTFGPEIRIRIFYEQGLRLVAATVFVILGYLTYGLFVAHLVSVTLAALLALRLVSKQYDLGAILRAPLTGPVAKEMRQYGLSIMPANIIKKLFSAFPVIYLNLLLPGAAGANASGFYTLARKIASIILAVRLTFEYVMAPLAAEKEGMGDRKALQNMYGFATRLSIGVALPLGAALILARKDILAMSPPEFQVISTAIAVLCIGRMIEATTGPSSSIIEMLAHRALPPLNALIGFSALLGVGYYMVPLYGVTGMAIGAAVGINVTALLSMIETMALFKLYPYNRLLIRPLIASLLLAGGIGAMIPYSEAWPAPFGFVAAITSLLLALFLLIRYGLTHEDTASLGKLNKLKPKRKAQTK